MSKFFAQIAGLARQDANSKKESAAFSGAHDDGGAALIETTVAAWEAGLEQKVPSSLQPYAILAGELTQDVGGKWFVVDPEWREFQRLQKKFGGK